MARITIELPPLFMRHNEAGNLKRSPAFALPKFKKEMMENACSPFNIKIT